jgi:hypothetical protein
VKAQGKRNSVREGDENAFHSVSVNKPRNTIHNETSYWTD